VKSLTDNNRQGLLFHERSPRLELRDQEPASRGIEARVQIDIQKAHGLGYAVLAGVQPVTAGVEFSRSSAERHDHAKDSISPKLEREQPACRSR